LGQALFGAWPIAAGQVRWFDQAGSLSPPQAVAAGVGCVPEDRQHESLLLDAPVRRNIALAMLPRLAQRWGWLDRSGEQQAAERQAAVLQIKAPSLASPVRVLSGGNQQKTALAKWLAAGVRALILIEPTQGIDVGVKFEIYALIAQLARSGAGLLLISSELAEAAHLAHRVIVLRGGRIAADLTGDQMTEDALLRAAAGV
jgi:ribose transport system ATP-binding protein